MGWTSSIVYQAVTRSPAFLAIVLILAGTIHQRGAEATPNTQPNVQYTARSRPQLSVQPEYIEIGLTTQVTLGCQATDYLLAGQLIYATTVRGENIGDDGKSREKGFVFTMRIMKLKKNGERGWSVLSEKRFTHPAELHINHTWPLAKPETFGTYRCDVIRSVVTSPGEEQALKTVKSKPVTIGDVGFTSRQAMYRALELEADLNDDLEEDVKWKTNVNKRLDVVLKRIGQLLNFARGNANKLKRVLSRLEKPSKSARGRKQKSHNRHTTPEPASNMTERLIQPSKGRKSAKLPKSATGNVDNAPFENPHSKKTSANVPSIQTRLDREDLNDVTNPNVTYLGIKDIKGKVFESVLSDGYSKFLLAGGNMTVDVGEALEGARGNTSHENVTTVQGIHIDGSTNETIYRFRGRLGDIKIVHGDIVAVSFSNGTWFKGKQIHTKRNISDNSVSEQLDSNLSFNQSNISDPIIGDRNGERFAQSTNLTKVVEIDFDQNETAYNGSRFYYMNDPSKDETTRNDATAATIFGLKPHGRHLNTSGIQTVFLTTNNPPPTSQPHSRYKYPSMHGKSGKWFTMLFGTPRGQKTSLRAASVDSDQDESERSINRKTFSSRTNVASMQPGNNPGGLNSSGTNITTNLGEPEKSIYRYGNTNSSRTKIDSIQ